MKSNVFLKSGTHGGIMTIICCIECIDINEIRCSWSAIYAYPIQATLATLDSIVKKTDGGN